MATQNPPQNTLYAALGIAADASSEEVEAAYAALSHSAAAQGESGGLLRIAYDTLRVPEARAAYDRKLARQAEDARAVRIIEHPPRRGFGRTLIVLLAVLGAGIYWMQREAPRSLDPDAARIRAERDNPLVQAQIQPVDEDVVAIATGPGTPATPPAMRPAPQQTSTKVMPTRGARKAGFDVEYLAWSAFQIRQRGSTGSGVLVAPDRILTNCHVLAGGASNGIVVTHSLTRQTTKVEKYARLNDEDACLLYAPGAGGEIIEWGSAASLRSGDPVYNLGHPGGSRDLIWSEAKFIDQINHGGNAYLRTSNYCRPGSSGGPLLDREGRLVGIVTSVMVGLRADGQEVYGPCQSVTEASARQLLNKPLFPIGFAPAEYNGN